MPTYEYRCPDGHEFEIFYRKISDAGAEVHCPECGKLAVRMMSAGAGLLFKGSGFYLTDYGKNAHRGTAPEGVGAGARKEGETSSAESKGGEAKPTESKSAEAKSGDKKPGDAKASESRPAESKSSKAEGASGASTSPSKKTDQ